MFDIVLQKATQKSRYHQTPHALEDPSPISSTFFPRSHNLLGEDILLTSPALFSDTYGPLGINTPISSAFLSMVEDSTPRDYKIKLEDAPAGSEEESVVEVVTSDNKRKRTDEIMFGAKRIKTAIEDEEASFTCDEEDPVLIGDDFQFNNIAEETQYQQHEQLIAFDANNLKLLQVILQNPYLTSLAQQQIPSPSHHSVASPVSSPPTPPSTPPQRKRKNKGDPANRQLVCNGTIKRKNKKSHPGDAFQLKFKLK
jgi:hypothetical protein